MPWLYALVIGMVVGFAVGFIIERLPLPPLLQSIGATFVAMALGAISVGLVWFLRPRSSGGSGAVSFYIDTRSLLFLLASGVLIALLHTVLGRFSVSAPALARHRTVILGCLGGLCGALPMAWVMVVSS